jgi:sugar phosphate isomerase/epimerase
MQPAISQVCTLSAPFEDDLAGYADAAGTAIELWLTKLEDHLRSHSVADVRAQADDRGLRFAAASYQGGILLSQGDARRVAWDQFQKRLDLCADLSVPTLVVTADFLGPFAQTDIERAQVSLKQAGQAADQRGIRLALEFQARNTFLNNLETAAAFVRSVEQPNVGICFDVFHYAVGPSKFDDLAHLTADNLFHVHVSDVADRPRELATDADRILPGDGDFPLPQLFARFREIGYGGYISLELFNPMFWTTSPQQVGEIGLTALRVALGLNRT